MSAIREALDALADALEAAVASKGGKAAAEAPAAAGKSRKKAEPTMDDTRDALIELNGKHGKPAVIDVLSRFGVTKIGDLPAEHFAECIKLANEYEEAEPEEEEDPLGESEEGEEEEVEEEEPAEEPEPPKRRRRAK